ncbi:MAG: ABC transporter ATP-binding protein [Clostridiales bacterium]|nr:ABC transporter ATP-binding protein [Clostridiales bacterium]
MTKEEKTQKRKTRKEEARLLASFLRGSIPLFALSIITAAISSLADMVNPQIIRIAIDNVLGGEEPNLPDYAMYIIEKAGGFEYLAGHLWIIAIAIMIVAVVHVAAQYLFRVSNTKASETLVKTMRDDLYTHIEHLPFSWHMKNKTGDIIQRCTSDIDTMKNFVSDQLTSIFRIVILLTMSLSFMIPMSGKLTLIALLPMPIILGYSFLFHKNIMTGFLKCDENEGILSSMAQENLTGVRVVRAFGRERAEKDKFTKHNEYYTGLWTHLASVMSRFWSTSDFLSGMQIMLVIVFGAVFCVKGEMTSGTYIAFISYNSMLVWPVRQLGRMISELSKAGVSISRVNYIMQSPLEKDKEGAQTPPLNKDISFENVSFAYEGCPEILHDISFDIKAGTTLGILGGTGSGKSTLMYLLDRLYDIPENSGRITIGGVDIADIKAEHLRSGIGMVLQEPFLFSRSIAENIGITRDGAELSEIRGAAKVACLDETVEGFTKGYDTFVGERGVTLSGGQKQRAAIARMLTQKTPIMVFDDSLSAVDTETDAKIRKSLEAQFGKSTIILISHRITTLSKADKIVVLDKGRIVESGTHDSLKDSGGIYSKIYAIQTGGIEEVSGQ